MLIELSHVTHMYGDVRALDDVTLEIGAGAIGLIGQNGAGKSTMMQILLGLVRPTQGTARVLGYDVVNAGMPLRGRVGYMPERDVLIPGMSGVEFVALAGELSGLPRRQAKRRAHETLSYLGLEEARYRLIEQYSVGMKQRLKLAATLVHDPDVLLLDEPTAGLDAAGRMGMLRLLELLAKRPGRSLIMSSHLLGDIERVCRSAIIVDRGVVVGQGKLEDLRVGRRRCYRIRWTGDGRPLLAALTSNRVEVSVDGQNDEAQIVVPDDWSNRTLFRLAEENGVVLNGIVPEEEDLDAVYHRLIVADRQPRPDATAVVTSGEDPSDE